MRVLSGLSRQIAISMVAVAAGCLTLFFGGFYVFYAVASKRWPQLLVFDDPLAFSSADWMVLAVTTALALAIAVVIASRLSHRILKPLTSVADGLRQLAQGNLAARASVVDRSVGEAAQLVEDFNATAERLEKLAKEQVFWNAAIAHELRTPVTILSGRLQALSDGVFEASEAQFRSLLSQVQGLSRLIEDMRVVGLSDSGHLSMDIRECELAPEIAAVAQLFEPQLTAAGLHCVLDLQAGIVRSDPLRIRQALTALLENARKHATPGGLQIRFHTQGGVAKLCVEDDGPGIAPEMAAHVFDAFQQGEAAKQRKGSGSGSGLGLAVVRAISLAHGGFATCSPSSRGGTIFEVSWPEAFTRAPLDVS